MPSKVTGTVRAPENEKSIRQAVLRNRSVWKYSSELSFSNCSVGHVLHFDLKLRAYKLAIVQQPRYISAQNSRKYTESKLLSRKGNIPESTVIPCLASKRKCVRFRKPRSDSRTKLIMASRSVDSMLPTLSAKCSLQEVK
ncbi:hypothetical protein NPIL_477971 [Nephila pilipes]|uniref:Uncharacterized protein n=1 Tax=Nephila pilipes TaxID=299642 RepID=A0A8X6PRQ9_NEPPI|nr:hypothetical protein NPIL_477971 [Nephila pilipes]